MTRKRGQVRIASRVASVRRDRGAPADGATTESGEALTETERNAVTEDAPSPRCLTVTEVMAIYRISRCTAYAQAASFRRSGPGHGIPSVKLGNSVRFPAAWIEAHIGHEVMAQSDVRSDVSSTNHSRTDRSAAGQLQRRARP
jgi:predicted DNA-binding transcriptional regulator AlpA